MLIILIPNPLSSLTLKVNIHYLSSNGIKLLEIKNIGNGVYILGQKVDNNLI